MNKVFLERPSRHSLIGITMNPIRYTAVFAATCLLCLPIRAQDGHARSNGATDSARQIATSGQPYRGMARFLQNYKQEYDKGVSAGTLRPYPDSFLSFRLEQSDEAVIHLRTAGKVAIWHCWYKGQSGGGQRILFWKDAPPTLTPDEISTVSSSYFDLKFAAGFDTASTLVDKQVSHCPYQYGEAWALREQADEEFRTQVAQAKERQRSAVEGQSRKRTTAERLKELENLKKQGLITQAEYEQQRKAIISGL